MPRAGADKSAPLCCKCYSYLRYAISIFHINTATAVRFLGGGFMLLMDAVILINAGARAV